MPRLGTYAFIEVWFPAGWQSRMFVWDQRLHPLHPLLICAWIIWSSLELSLNWLPAPGVRPTRILHSRYPTPPHHFRWFPLGRPCDGEGQNEQECGAPLSCRPRRLLRFTWCMCQSVWRLLILAAFILSIALKTYHGYFQPTVILTLLKIRGSDKKRTRFL